MLNSTKAKSLFDEVEVMKNRIHCKRADALSCLANETKRILIFLLLTR